jgi:hypothetical protein
MPIKDVSRERRSGCFGSLKVLFTKRSGEPGFLVARLVRTKKILRPTVPKLINAYIGEIFCSM